MKNERMFLQLTRVRL